ncbi:hypothetical protein KP509_38G045400 [Ceratopteris richardii]|uniref:Polysaccharide biosynthesis domain-containing protein n=1 Tax=Ceratopteris richardii TaxID=49495 RepID=A0A8T2Q4H3_CERRI|nr:hypothetical protein KP509_38G045400 [Ceratopteris richardii]
MAFSHFIIREQIGRFWPFFVLLFLGIVYLIHVDFSMSRRMLSPTDARKLQSYVASPYIQHSSDRKHLPYPVMLALVHYATTSTTPQQNREEIIITANILSQKAPCNFLIFGLGYDSLLWQTLNYGGNTVFLEEDANWIAEVEKSNPEIRAIHVHYSTLVSDADNLLAYARQEKRICSPEVDLRSSKCKLAMTALPEKIYDEKWDVVMIDAPRGYFEEAPGRMSAIFSAAVIAKGRNKKESTHILLHDIDRSVEKTFSMEFFCFKNLVEGTGKLWHFQIYGDGESRSSEFCRSVPVAASLAPSSN